MALNAALDSFNRSLPLFARSAVDGTLPPETISEMEAVLQAGGFEDIAGILEIVRENPLALGDASERNKYARLILGLIEARPADHEKDRYMDASRVGKTKCNDLYRD